jgi:hypothetical protein
MTTELKRKIAFAFSMGLVTTCIISFTVIGVNLGFVPGFVYIWLKSWLIAYAVVVPAILFLGPVIQSVITRFINDPKP